jgi:alkylation response protein AidB-like acyl-CoA dehydrogenase
MDLSWSKSEEAFRMAARSWLETNVPATPLPSGDTRAGFAAHVAWEKELHAAGWSVVSWPRAYGGRGATLWEWLIFEEEYYRAGAPQRVTQNGIFLLAPTLFAFGTQAQRDRVLPKLAAAEQLWCQGWSEPGAGSDLASVRSTATAVEGGFRLSGEKTWCTRGAFCDALFGLFRTNPDAPAHRGLTYFMVPLSAPGVQVRGVRRLDGDEGFAQVFFDDVFVADSEVIGEVDKGWQVAMATTSSERGLTLRSPGRFRKSAQQLVELYHERAGKGTGDAVLRDRVLQAVMDAEAYDLYTLRSVTRMQAGESLGAESSLSKLFWSSLDLQLHETALALLGPEAERTEDVVEARAGARDWMKGYQFALAGPIYAGTNEIQRNIVAERLLGLPKT